MANNLRYVFSAGIPILRHSREGGCRKSRITPSRHPWECGDPSRSRRPLLQEKARMTGDLTA